MTQALTGSWFDEYTNEPTLEEVGHSPLTIAHGAIRVLDPIRHHEVRPVDPHVLHHSARPRTEAVHAGALEALVMGTSGPSGIGIRSSRIRDSRLTFLRGATTTSERLLDRLRHAHRTVVRARGARRTDPANAAATVRPADPAPTLRHAAPIEDPFSVKPTIFDIPRVPSGDLPSVVIHVTKGGFGVCIPPLLGPITASGHGRQRGASHQEPRGDDPGSCSVGHGPSPETIGTYQIREGEIQRIERSRWGSLQRMSMIRVRSATCSPTHSHNCPWNTTMLW